VPKNKLPRPETTLIFSISVDGRITSRDSDKLDPDKNWKKKQGVRGILQQFYGITQSKNDYSLTTGQAMVKNGVNIKTILPSKKSKLNLIIWDQTSCLTTKGINYLIKSVNRLIFITKANNPYLKSKKIPKNLQLISYKRKANLKQLINQLKTKYKVKKLTIQSAGTLNSQWINQGLIDYLTVIIYPLLIGNSGTPVLIDTTPLKVLSLNLESSRVFDNRYLALRYKVINPIPPKH